MRHILLGDLVVFERAIVRLLLFTMMPQLLCGSEDAQYGVFVYNSRFVVERDERHESE